VKFAACPPEALEAKARNLQSLRFTALTLQRFNRREVNFPRNLASDFLQYNCERPEMSSQ
jgi:hypothetical protein